MSSLVKKLIQIPAVQNTFLVIGSILIGLLMLEVGLRVFTDYPITEGSNKTYGDPYLLYRASQSLAEIDENGFRNPDNLESYTIAAIGDSQTFGVNTDSAGSWPKQLGNMIDENVYNYGIAGYGFYQYIHLIKQASDKYNKIIVGLFPANDFDGASTCDTMRLNAWKKEIRKLGLKQPTCSEGHQLSIEAPKEEDSFFYKMREGSFFSAAFSILFQNVIRDSYESDEHPVYTYGSHPIDIKEARAYGWQTDITNPAVSENVSVFKAMISDLLISDPSLKDKLCFFTIPSKGLTLQGWGAENPDAFEGDFEAATFYADKERELITEISTYLGSQDLRVFNAYEPVLQAFEQAQTEGREFFPARDGHPFKDGYTAYAQTAERCF